MSDRPPHPELDEVHTADTSSNAPATPAPPEVPARLVHALAGLPGWSVVGPVQAPDGGWFVRATWTDHGAGPAAIAGPCAEPGSPGLGGERGASVGRAAASGSTP